MEMIEFDFRTAMTRNVKVKTYMFCSLDGSSD